MIFENIKNFEIAISKTTCYHYKRNRRMSDENINRMMKLYGISLENYQNITEISLIWPQYRIQYTHYSKVTSQSKMSSLKFFIENEHGWNEFGGTRHGLNDARLKIWRNKYLNCTIFCMLDMIFSKENFFLALKDLLEIQITQNSLL